MTTSEQWKELESKYYMFLVRRQPMVLERGDGARVWDVDGKEYLDFTSGWAVNNAGHCNEAVADAIAEQARTLVQTSNQFYTIPQLKLAEILVENSCLDKIFICNSGAEANEGAIKLAKKYGKKNKDGAYEIIIQTELKPLVRSPNLLPELQMAFGVESFGCLRLLQQIPQFIPAYLRLTQPLPYSPIEFQAAFKQDPVILPDLFGGRCSPMGFESQKTIKIGQDFKRIPQHVEKGLLLIPAPYFLRSQPAYHAVGIFEQTAQRPKQEGLFHLTEPQTFFPMIPLDLLKNSGPGRLKIDPSRITFQCPRQRQERPDKLRVRFEHRVLAQHPVNEPIMKSGVQFEINAANFHCS